MGTLVVRVRVQRAGRPLTRLTGVAWTTYAVPLRQLTGQCAPRRLYFEHPACGVHRTSTTTKQPHDKSGLDTSVKSARRDRRA